MKNEKYVEPTITPANASKPAPPLGPATQSPLSPVSGRAPSVIVLPGPTVADMKMEQLGGVLAALLGKN